MAVVYQRFDKQVTYGLPPASHLWSNFVLYTSRLAIDTNGVSRDCLAQSFRYCNRWKRQYNEQPQLTPRDTGPHHRKHRSVRRLHCFSSLPCCNSDAPRMPHSIQNDFLGRTATNPVTMSLHQLSMAPRRPASSLERRYHSSGALRHSAESEDEVEYIDVPLSLLGRHNRRCRRRGQHQNSLRLPLPQPTALSHQHASSQHVSRRSQRSEDPACAA